MSIFILCIHSNKYLTTFSGFGIVGCDPAWSPICGRAATQGRTLPRAPKPCRPIPFKPRRYPHQFLGVTQLPRATFHVPPTAGRQVITAAFEDQKLVGAIAVHIIGDLPNATHEIFQSEGICAFRVRAYRVQFAVARIAQGRIHLQF
mgnify:CR=1 FL=1